MADKTISDLTATSTVADADVFELEVGGNSRKVTGQNLAKYVRNGNLSGAKVRKSANLTAQNLTGFNAVTFNTEDFDTDAYHDNASNTDRLTPPAAGYYMVIGYAELANVTSANWARAVIGHFNSGGSYLNDVAVQQIEISATGNFQFQVMSIEYFNAGDYAKLHIQVESDTSVDITTNTHFAMIRLG